MKFFVELFCYFAPLVIFSFSSPIIPVVKNNITYPSIPIDDLDWSGIHPPNNNNE